jgi:hypothetical protein
MRECKRIIRTGHSRLCKVCAFSLTESEEWTACHSSHRDHRQKKTRAFSQRGDRPFRLQPEPKQIEMNAKMNSATEGELHRMQKGPIPIFPLNY